MAMMGSSGPRMSWMRWSAPAAPTVNPNAWQAYAKGQGQQQTPAGIAGGGATGVPGAPSVNQAGQVNITPHMLAGGSFGNDPSGVNITPGMFGGDNPASLVGAPAASAATPGLGSTLAGYGKDALGNLIGGGNVDKLSSLIGLFL